MSKRLHDTAMAVLGPAAPLWRGADDNPGDGAWQRSWLYYQASSIWAGTNEIQRNIIGERVLGLPREPRNMVACRRDAACRVLTTVAALQVDSPTTFETIRYEVDGPVATITLARPDAANAQNRA